MDFPSKSGCPMCGIVSRALHDAPNSPLFAVSPTSASTPRVSRGMGTGPEILWRDDNFTVYRERAHPVSSHGHLVIVFNLHVPSLYMLSSSDVPLLVALRELAHRLLSQLAAPSASPAATPVPSSPFSSRQSSAMPSSATSSLALCPSQSQFRIGFITPPWKDSQIPVRDHLHVHAYIAPADLCGWWRSVAYSPVAWYAVEDLIAEIREESTNNRIKSGYENRAAAPIDMIPSAGARSGTADGLETTEAGLASADLEAGGTRTPTTALTPAPPAARLAVPSHLDLNTAIALAPVPSTPTSATRMLTGVSSSSGRPEAGS